MNYRGSYRHLIRNARAAMLSAIEIYNKPRIAYREECFVILLLNAWELALKALLSRNGRSVFYAKKRKQPYRTLSWLDAFMKAQAFFPKELHPIAVRRNLDLLSTYRDNAVHFYNARGFGSLIYALSQTSVSNFRVLLEKRFGIDLGEEITWQLLPLGLNPPIDPIEYISGNEATTKKGRAAVRQFLSELAAATKEVEEADADTGQLLTLFRVKLESTKKIEKADVVLGVGKPQEEGPLVVTRTMDPNVTHPLRQKDVVEKVGTLHNKPFNSHVFQSIVWKHDLKGKPQFCWQAKEGILTRYSNDVIPWIQRLSEADLEAALKDYKDHLKARVRRKK